MTNLFNYFSHGKCNHYIKKFDEKWDVILFFVISLGIGYLFSVHGRGGPNSSDITLYLNIGLNNIKEPFVLNRYTHIYLQNIFVRLVNNPLEGFHIYWGFLMGMNTFLVYYSSRLFIKTNTYFHGLLAVLLFYSIPAIGNIQGVVSVDVTAMTIVLGLVSIYLVSNRNENKKAWLIVAFGILFFFALKTKETTLPVLILLLGFGWNSRDNFKKSRFMENMVWIVCGVLIGILIFILLNSIFLKEPLYGFRFVDWQDYFGTYVSDSPYIIDAIQGDNLDDWYKGYFFEFSFYPFILFILSGVAISRQENLQKKLLWILPILLILFVIISINNRFGYISRFVYPVFPLLSICAAQIINISEKDFKIKSNFYLPILVIGILIIGLIRLIMRTFIPESNLYPVFNLFYLPVTFSLLLVSLYLFRDKVFWNLVNIVLIFGLVISSFITTFKNLFIYRQQERIFNNLVLPFDIFSEEISFFPEMNIYVVNSVFEHSTELSIVKNVDEFLSLFNIYFNASSTRENITYKEMPTDIIADILNQGYDYVLITNQDWQNMLIDEEGVKLVFDKYDKITEPEGQFVLLVPN